MIGKIVKGIAGFYYVDVGESGIYKCRAKGIFRKEGMKPLVGDNVRMEITHIPDREGNVEEIFERRNELLRPAVANVDQALILFAMQTPDPNFLLLDRFLISARMCDVPCVICINKADAAKAGMTEEIRRNYEKCGSGLHFISVREETGIAELKRLLKGKTTVLAGPSGVGKSSLTNLLTGAEHMEVGEISKKLARGKNTTRHSELIKIDEGTFICDTPGFSALDTQGIEKEKLQDYYEEFRPYKDNCRFQGCVHVGEPDCAVKDAVRDGLFAPGRYDNYVLLYEELKDQERRRYQ